MTFGKEQDAITNGRKGALISNRNTEAQRKRAITKWKSKAYRKKFRLSMRKSGAWSKEHLAEMGRKSRDRENKTIKAIKHRYEKIFLPHEVCDRIAIKHGEVFFIEVKGLKQKLRPKQEFKEISKDRYIVIRSP